jgi:hypothetical protein
MRTCGRGTGVRVRGSKGGGVRGSSTGPDCSLEAGIAAVISSCGWGCGAGEVRSSGLASDRSREVGRSVWAGGSNADGAMSGAVLAGTSSAFGGGRGAETGSKLKGLFWSLGGGSGDTGDMSCSLSISGLRVGEGVISGVSVSTCTVGMGGGGLFAY